MKQNHLSAFILGFILPAVLFTLVVGPVANKPVRIKNCSVRSDALKVLGATADLGETSEDGSEDALSDSACSGFKAPVFSTGRYFLSYLDLSEHRITDHAHDGRGPPTLS